MSERLIRTERLLGREAVERLNAAHVAVFGIGGVGGYAAEALARGGVGELTLVDNDTVAESNLNRQIIAATDTIGQMKAAVMAKRINSISKEIKVHESQLFVLPETIGEIDFSKFDYIIDAIDTVAGKIALAKAAKECGVPVIACMGTGNKLDPCAFTVTDIEKTDTCPLARVMRKELKKKAGICHIKVVFSKEKALTPEGDERVPGSVSFVPGVAGMIAAGEVIKDLISGAGVVPH